MLYCQICYTNNLMSYFTDTEICCVTEKLLLQVTAIMNSQPAHTKPSGQTFPNYLTAPDYLSPFYGHFPGEPGLANTRMSPFWILLQLRVMEVMETAGAIRHAELLSKSPPTNQHPAVLQAGCPSCCPTNSVRATVPDYYW